MCDKCKEAGTFQHTFKLHVTSSEREINADNREYFRALLDAHIKLNNPEYRGKLLRFDDIQLKYDWEHSWLTGIFKVLETKPYKRP
ncbi:hypothetical protein MA9V1_044 [Chryseobacterium phage MA9V-1]|nr:hypothetical protein MA9V1_044 [Chryseobacterium phage MA9V-1]